MPIPTAVSPTPDTRSHLERHVDAAAEFGQRVALDLAAGGVDLAVTHAREAWARALYAIEYKAAPPAARLRMSVCARRVLVLP